MKKMFIVNSEEFKVGNTYSKADSKKFKKVNDFNDAVWQLTPNKNMIVIADELTDEKNIRYRIEEELDYKKIFNSDEIYPLKKLDYFSKIKDVDYDKYQVLYDEGMKFIKSCKDLDFLLHVIYTLVDLDLKMYSHFIENIIENDSTGKYLKEITQLRYGAKYYSESIVNKLIKVTNDTCNLSNLMYFILNLSRCRESNLHSEIDFYDILNLIDEYDKEGKYYVMLNEALPYFELNYIQTKIIELAKANNDCTYCVDFLNKIVFNSKFNSYKTIRYNDFIDIIIDFWNEDIKTYFISHNTLKFISKENLIKLKNKCNNDDKNRINLFLTKTI